jgi:putative endopeptidase
MTPHFDWKRYLDAAGMPRPTSTSTQPKFMTRSRRSWRHAARAWKTYLKWNVINARGASLSEPIVKAGLRVLRQVPARREGDEAALEALRRGDRRSSARRSASVRRALLPARGQGAHAGDGEEPPAGDGRHHPRPRLDGARTRKQKALEKLSTFNPKVGYPDKWKDYSGVTHLARFVLGERRGRARSERRGRPRQIGKPVDRGRWGMTPPTSNAYYNPLLNEIVFPAGILQPPAFDVNATDAVNYGAIGVVIGHEISHGFDDQGAQFDAQGRLKPTGGRRRSEAFQARRQCVVDQFEGYFIEPGIHHNGKLVLGESIGDLAGAKIAYLAFQKAQARRPAPTIDGFTPEQQFFIGWGQFRGDEIRPETQRMMVQGDPHPVGEVPRHRPAVEPAGVSRGVRLQTDAPMVRPEGEALRGVVSVPSHRGSVPSHHGSVPSHR